MAPDSANASYLCTFRVIAVVAFVLSTVRGTASTAVPISFAEQSLYTPPDFSSLGFPSGVSTYDPTDGFFHPTSPPIIPYWTRTITGLGSAHPIPNLDPATTSTNWAYNASFDLVSCPAKVWATAVDDGPRGFTSDYVALLSKYSAVGTFFILGGNLVVNSTWATQVREAFDAGHQIASVASFFLPPNVIESYSFSSLSRLHTWSHRHLTTLTTEEIIGDLIWNALAVKQVINKIPRFVRPPYGDVDNRVRTILAAFGFIEVMWNTNTFDTDIVPNTGDVGSLNDTSQFTVANSTAIINETLAQGYGPSLQYLPHAGFIPLQHELFQEQLYVARNELEAVSARGFSFASVAFCYSGGMNDSMTLRYFDDSEPFAAFLASIQFPINVGVLQGVPGAWPDLYDGATTGASKTSGSAPSCFSSRPVLRVFATLAALLAPLGSAGLVLSWIV
ncbi:chitin deacetylase [Cladochytrium tenue]|nr:chitin deacetylase [Cladochytrium tenue]